MANIIVLGCGMVGSVMARDLATVHNVTAVDLNKHSLKKVQEFNQDIKTQVVDLTDADAVVDIIIDGDLVLNAVPGFMGFELLKTVLSCKKNIVDISFFAENPSDLDYLAKQNDVYAFVDCGVAPGMSNVILGHYNEQMTINKYECLVGGLPVKRKWPFEYKAPFSPIDVIEEYTRPARYIENSQLITREPLSDVELINIDKVGTLECFNTDGLRSLIESMPSIPNMKEKTLRYPGHAEYIQVLAASGFFSEEPIEVNGVPINPREFSSNLLIDNWKLKRNEREFTVMRIIIEGEQNGKSKRFTYNLYDETDLDNEMSSMARTTGFTATAAINFLLENKPDVTSGVYAPEHLGSLTGAYDYFINYLKDRNVQYKKEETTL
ncbi:MAG: saccharopine dehydrogenase C-terminal domain-containing protein [Kangiellaceae bacterium]|jgi:saccharopine dehydrogenase-like NADP-dependent oxidoreductase|nr:saccharopine dehydrogenase C-terminal domain-containing protein [Kangiellaceae bacterium]